MSTRFSGKQRAMLSFTSFFTFLCFFAGNGLASAKYYCVIKDGVNLRSGPARDTQVIYQLPAGYPLLLLEQKKTWLKVSDYEGDKGWIEQSMVNESPHVIVKVRQAKVRKEPNTKSAEVGTANKEVILLRVGKPGEWVKVSHPDLSGWVQRDLIWP